MLSDDRLLFEVSASTIKRIVKRMEAREAQFEGVAFSALSDPSSMATVAAGDPAKAETLLEIQLKLHLLTSKHILLSKGFLFDNPGLWALVKKEHISEGLIQHGSSTATTLIIQTTRDQDSGKNKDDLDEHFRTWIFGADRDRVLVPSATRIVHASEKRNEAGARLRKLRSNSEPTMEQYARELDFLSLLEATPQMRKLFESCSRTDEPSDRYTRFTSDVRALVATTLAERSNGHGPLSHLYTTIDEVQTFLAGEKVISRSRFETWNPAIWWLWAPYVNHFRLIAHRPNSVKGVELSLLGSAPSRAEALHSLRSVLPQIPTADLETPNWSIALQKLPFEAIFTIRGETKFRQVLDSLARARSQGGENARIAQLDILRSTWGPSLTDHVAKFAPQCIVKKTAAAPAWVSPLVQVAGTTALALEGGLPALHTLIGVSATSSMLIGVAGGAGTGLLALGIICATKIANIFRVDTPEKAAQLIVDTVVDDFATPSESRITDLLSLKGHR